MVPGLAMLGQDGTLTGAAAKLEEHRPPRLSVNGCIILQALLAMPQSSCKHVTDALLALPPAELHLLSRDAAGTRVLEAFLKVRTLRTQCTCSTGNLQVRTQAALRDSGQCCACLWRGFCAGPGCCCCF